MSTVCRRTVGCPVHWLLAVSLLALALGGCVSAKERFERARNFESEGRYADAAWAYVKVLEDEPGFPNARRKLFEASQRAVDGWMQQARTAADAERYERAVVHLDEIRNLREACRGVDVSLPLPDGYTAFRDDTERRAADALMAEADAAAEAGDWPAAYRSYDRARRYVDTAERIETIDERQAEVLLGWADAEMQRGTYRGAYQRAARVFDLVPDTHPLVEEAEALRATAVERGTRRVAFLPLWRTEAADRALSDVFLSDLNDVLTARYWSSPPPFIASADPIDVRRTMRRYGVDRDVLSRRDAAEVGRGVGADFVVTGEVTEFVAAETDVDEERVPVAYVPDGRGPTSGRENRRSNDDAPADTAYVHRTYDLELEAVIEYRVVEVRTGRVVDRGTADAEAEGAMEDARFDGDWRNLDLSGAEKDLFDPEVRQRREQEIETRLLDRLAAEYATTATDGVLDEIE
jgi:tetratricopeptide (TPR) repeat protein